MSPLYFALVALAAHGSSPRAQPRADQCTIQNDTHNISYIEPSTDWVGFCGPVAYRNLLHQRRCNSPGYVCETPSLIEIAKMNYQAPWPGEDWLKQEVAAGLADERCAPFSGLYPKPHVEIFEQGDWLTVHKIILKNVDAAIPLCEMDEAKKRILNSASNQSEVAVQAAANRSVLSAHDRYLDRANCPKRPFPPIAFRNANLSGLMQNNVSLSEFMRKWLDLSGAMLVSLYTRMGSSEPTPHAITILNMRERCCAGFCRVQYQAFDDTGLQWADGNAMEGGWVDETFLRSKLDGPFAGEFTWIAPENSKSPAVEARGRRSRSPAAAEKGI